MQSPSSPLDSNNAATQACTSCKARKRKCDKVLPRCGLCTKKNLLCDYTKPVQSNTLTPFPTSDFLLGGTEQNTRTNRQQLDPQTILFLDPELLRFGQLETPRTDRLSSILSLQLVGNEQEIRATASKFFDSTHIWMPFISKFRLYDHHLHPTFLYNADITLLSLCMKLISTSLPEAAKDPRTPIYHATKKFYTGVENSGNFSIQVLQAGILIALYELGHGIYPSAYLSIGSCARYAYALGINPSAKSHAIKVLTLVELEEKRRVWWAIVILDRFVSIGCPGRPPATEDPNPHDLLPTDDDAWDRGEMSSITPSELSSPSQLHMSKFALLCQASRLLGQVLHHISDRVVNQEMHDDESMQLDRTINAMISAAQELTPPDNDQIAFGYGVLITLHEHTTSFSRPGFAPNAEHLSQSKSALESIAKVVTDCLPEKFPQLEDNSKGQSPWGIYVVYRSAVTYMRIMREGGDPNLAVDLNAAKQCLSIVNKRWNVAGTYLRLLEAQEVMGIDWGMS